MMKMPLPKTIKRFSLSRSTSVQNTFPWKFFTRRLRKNQLSLKKMILILNYRILDVSLEIQFALLSAYQLKKKNSYSYYCNHVATPFTTVSSNSPDILFKLKNFKSDTI